MALEPAENSLPVLHPYFYEAPEQHVPSLRAKATALKTLAVITNLAVGIITTALLAITLLTTVPLLGPLPLGLIATAIICGLSSPKIHQAAKGYAAKARFGERIAQELELIKNWKTPEIKAFFAHHELSLEHLPIESLAQINPEPLCALLPLIARFNYLDKHFRKEQAKYEKNLETYRADPKLKDVARDIVIRKIEKACKSKLRAAYLLGVLAKPQTAPAIEAIGFPASLQQRCFESFFLGQTNYFVFNNQAEPPITQQEMIGQNPDGLCRRLYPNSDIFLIRG